MSFIGPNFRPPHQQASSASGSKQVANQPTELSPSAQVNTQSASGNTLPAGALPLAALLAGQQSLAPGALAQLMRNLFSLPKEMMQLLAFLSEQNPAVGQALLHALSSEEVKVPLEALQDFLQGRLDGAQEKLLKLIQGNPVSIGAAGDSGTLMQGLAELADKIKQGPQGALNATVILYLPFYPLHPPQALTLRFEPPSQEEDDRSDASETSAEPGEPQLVLYLETLTLGSFRAVILPDAQKPQGHWQAVVSHGALAVPYLDAIAQGVHGMSTAQSVFSLIFTHQTDRVTAVQGSQGLSHQLPKPEAPLGQQSVGFHPTGGVSIMAVQCAYQLIRVILELDSRNALLSVSPSDERT